MTTTTEPPAVAGIAEAAPPGVAGAGATLPRTGGDVGPVVLVGLLVLGLGGVMCFGSHLDGSSDPIRAEDLDTRPR
jgi:hypothetical protein